MADALNEALMVLLAGMTVVFVSLVLLAGLIWLVRTVDETINARRIRRYEAGIAEATGGEELNDEIVAVLAAAATVAIRRPIVIRRVRFLQATRNPAWAVTGRLNIMGSHAPQRRKS